MGHIALPALLTATPTRTNSRPPNAVGSCHPVSAWPVFAEDPTAALTRIIKRIPALQESRGGVAVATRILLTFTLTIWFVVVYLKLILSNVIPSLCRMTNTIISERAVLRRQEVISLSLLFFACETPRRISSRGHHAF